MNKITIIYDKAEPKKHSVRYNTSQAEPAVSSIYISRSALGGQIPLLIKVTIEEVE